MTCSRERISVSVVSLILLDCNNAGAVGQIPGEA